MHPNSREILPLPDPDASSLPSRSGSEAGASPSQGEREWGGRGRGRRAELLARLGGRGAARAPTRPPPIPPWEKARTQVPGADTPDHNNQPQAAIAEAEAPAEEDEEAPAELPDDRPDEPVLPDDRPDEPETARAATPPVPVGSPRRTTPRRAGPRNYLSCRWRARQVEARNAEPPAPCSGSRHDW